MAPPMFPSSLLSLSLIFFFSSLSSVTPVNCNNTTNTNTAAAAATTTYIVHVNTHHKPSPFATHADWYTANLLSLSIRPTSVLYTYNHAITGFAVSLSPSQADSLRRSPAVLNLFPDSIYHPQTTRTPSFLGLDQLNPSTNALLNLDASNIIIGLLDFGIWPESPSFNDKGMPDVPKRWHGVCETSKDFKASDCNHKLVGARSFSKGYEKAMGKPSDPGPRDRTGHGTHTASIAAGAVVPGASMFGYAAGTARGMAPTARIASYKVCWFGGACLGSDVLAGIDAAVADGVDVLSLSLGLGKGKKLNKDLVAIASLAAVQKGIFVAAAAGNDGPAQSSIMNDAAWITTVGFGSIDRNFPASVTLGNKKKFTGLSIYSGDGLGKEQVPVAYFEGEGKSKCAANALNPVLARGKIVVCENEGKKRVEAGQEVKRAGGVGMILVMVEGREQMGDPHLIPTVSVGQVQGKEIKTYVGSTKNPTAGMSFEKTVLGVRPAPMAGGFSSRGPSVVVAQILKPDLIAPGLNILAAWPDAVSPTGVPEDKRPTKFNIKSGTSMACPHVSGIGALLKVAHPNWSPSAIKSALMTTAYTVDNTNSPLRDAAGNKVSTPFAHGSGHIDPKKSLDPGLVYDVSFDDYVAFVCSLGYSLKEVQAIVRRPTEKCERSLSSPGDLNYPSFSVIFNKKQTVVKYTRELKNVGEARSVYKVDVGVIGRVEVKVEPTTLTFNQVGEKHKYTVTFTSKKEAKDVTTEAFGWINWSDKKHQVRSPVAYLWQDTNNPSVQVL